MMNFQDSFKNLFDAEAFQANFNKAYDFNAIQESVKKFYDVEAIQENFKSFYNFDQFQGNLDKLVDADTLKAAKEYMESFANPELAQKNAKLAANLVATNVNALTDAVILQSVQVRETVEDALAQADTLLNSKDLEAAFEAQKKFAEEQQEIVAENFWNKAGLFAGLVESNMNFVKDAFVKAQPVKKAA
ncbi:MAG: phasin family protein [Pseudomonadales bacterium]|nr:phasin family protein [Pseudomonadales bacterium]MCP5215840.1 phasin family protein [Pseudomonadales bacterium]